MCFRTVVRTSRGAKICPLLFHTYVGTLMFCSQPKVWAKPPCDERVRLRRTGNVEVINNQTPFLQCDSCKFEFATCSATVSGVFGLPCALYWSSVRLNFVKTPNICSCIFRQPTGQHCRALYGLAYHWKPQTALLGFLKQTETRCEQSHANKVN